MYLKQFAEKFKHHLKIYDFSEEQLLFAWKKWIVICWHN